MTRLRSAAALAAASIVAAACGAETGEQTELTRAEKDSIVAQLPVPGASGVGTAMQARDRANARADEHDALVGNRP